MNVLLIDDVNSNLCVLNLHIDEWFDANDYNIDSVIVVKAKNRKVAFDKI